MSILRKLAGQTAIYGFSSILGRLLNYLLVPLYTRVFATGEYGVVTQLYAFAAFLNILFTYGLETAYFRFSQTEKESRKVYSTALISILVTSIVLFALLTFFAVPFTHIIGDAGKINERLPLYVIWFAGILATDAIAAIPFARLRQQNKALRFALIRLVNILLNIGFNVFFLVICPKLIASDPHHWISTYYDATHGVGYVFLSNLLASLVTLLLLLPELLPAREGLDVSLWKKMMVYSLPLMVAGFAGMVNETFDRILLPMLVRDPSTALDQLGIYGACYKLSILMTLFVQTFRYAADPFFFSHADKEDARQIYARVMNWFVLGCGFIFLGVMLYIEVWEHFIGERFRSGLPVVPILLLANWCLGIYLNISIWYKLTGKTSWGAWFSVAGALVTLLFNFLLIPSMGYMGAAWTTLICYAFIMVLSYFTGQQYYKVPYDLAVFVHAMVAALALYGVAVYVDRFNLPVALHYLLHTFLLLLYPLSVWVFLRRKTRKFVAKS